MHPRLCPDLGQKAPGAPDPALADELSARGLVHADAFWTPLHGGRTNRVWRVEGGGQTLALKIYSAGAGNPVFPNDAGAEAQVLRAMAGQGVAPELLHVLDTAQGPCLIYTRIAEDGQTENIALLFAVLARVHACSAPDGLRAAYGGSAAILEQVTALLAGDESPAAVDLRAMRPAGTVPPSGRRALLHGDPCEAPISVKCWMPLSEGRKDGDESCVRCSA